MADACCSADGYTSINFQGACECLKVVPGMEKAAAFYETRRCVWLGFVALLFGHCLQL
jgi:hypothetical protein